MKSPIPPEFYKVAWADDFWHQYGQDTPQTLAVKIDKHFGGWPVEFDQLMFFHGDHSPGPNGRFMTFTKKGPNTG